MPEKTLILASQSPRRKTLLAQLGYSFTVQASNIDETLVAEESPSDYVLRLAVEKAQKVFLTLPNTGKKSTVVLGSDTSVVMNDIILGKPDNLNDCINTLSLLSDKQHEVLTAVAVVSDRKIQTKLVTTKVIFKAISGSYSAVVGLPLYETAELLAQFTLPTIDTQNYS